MSVDAAVLKKKLRIKPPVLVCLSDGGWPVSATHSRATYLVAKMEHARALQGADQVELDVFGREAFEQTPALAKQHRHQLDLEHVEQPSLQALLGRVGA